MICGSVRKLRLGKLPPSICSVFHHINKNQLNTIHTVLFEICTSLQTSTPRSQTKYVRVFLGIRPVAQDTSSQGPQIHCSTSLMCGPTSTASVAVPPAMVGTFFIMLYIKGSSCTERKLERNYGTHNCCNYYPIMQLLLAECSGFALLHSHGIS